MGNRTKAKRIWELDFFRGIALILMIIFHLLYNLREFYGLPIAYYQGIPFYIGKVSVILFMLLAGISSVLSSNNLRRGLRILAYAFLITVATHLWDPAWGIKWGILHFLGASILLYPWIKGLPDAILLIGGVVLIYIGTLIPVVSFDFLFPLGIRSAHFSSADYYPLIPWFSVFLFGVILGKRFYRNVRSLFTFSVRPNNPIVFIGAHTLPIYLIHQPLILLVLSLIFERS